MRSRIIDLIQSLTDDERSVMRQMKEAFTSPLVDWTDIDAAAKLHDELVPLPICVVNKITNGKLKGEAEI